MEHNTTLREEAMTSEYGEMCKDIRDALATGSTALDYDLPPLPEPANMRVGWARTEYLPWNGPAYTADQMRAYAAQAVERLRAELLSKRLRYEGLRADNEALLKALHSIE
jgi:hypothetical protein